MLGRCLCALILLLMFCFKIVGVCVRPCIIIMTSITYVWLWEETWIFDRIFSWLLWFMWYDTTRIYRWLYCREIYIWCNLILIKFTLCLIRIFISEGCHHFYKGAKIEVYLLQPNPFQRDLYQTTCAQNSMLRLLYAKT